MAETLKVLAQVSLVASTLTDVYTVPASTTTAVSSIVVCNQDAFSATFRLSVAVLGAADDPKQYLYYDTEIPANDTFVAKIGITLGYTISVGDVLQAYTSGPS